MNECVYVAAGANGLLKVGRTRHPSKRKAALGSLFRAKGDCLTRFHHCALLPTAYVAEYQLIETVAARVQSAGGREWFRHGNFDHAVRAAEELTAYYSEQLKGWKPYAPPRGHAEWLEKLAAEKARAKQARAEWRAQHEARRASKARLKHPGLHAFIAIASVLDGVTQAVEPAQG